MRAKLMSRRRRKVAKTGGFRMVSDNFQWKNGENSFFETSALLFVALLHTIHCSFATLNASEGDSFTIPAAQSFL